MASRAVTPPSSPTRWSGSRARTSRRYASRQAPTRSPLSSRRRGICSPRPTPTASCPATSPTTTPEPPPSPGRPETYLPCSAAAPRWAILGRVCPGEVRSAVDRPRRLYTERPRRGILGSSHQASGSGIMLRVERDDPPLGKRVRKEQLLYVGREQGRSASGDRGALRPG